MSAPAQNSIGLADANTSARTSGRLVTCSQTLDSASTTSGEIEFAGGRSSQAIAICSRVSSFTGPSSQPASGRAYGKKPWPDLDPEPPLRDQPAQDQRRLKRLAPFDRGALEPLEHLVEADLVGARERRRHDPRAGHHPEVDLAGRGDPLLEHQTALDQRLQREAVDDLGRELLRGGAHEPPPCS